MPPSDTLYQQLLTDLRRYVINSLHGEALLPERKLAAMHGVGRSTVHRVLLALAREHLVRPNVGSGWVSVANKRVVHNASDSDLRLALISRRPRGAWGRFEIYEALFAEVRRRKLKLVDVPNERQNPSTPALNRLDLTRIPWNTFDVGMLVEVEDADTLMRFGRSRRKLVSVDHDATLYGIDSVIFDNASAGRVAARHLFDLGHRRFSETFEVNPPGWPSDQAWTARRHSFEATVGELGGTINPDGVIKIPRRGLPVLEIMEEMKQTVTRWTQLPAPERPTGLFIEFTSHEEFLVNELAKHQLRIPRDLSLIVVDWSPKRLLMHDLALTQIAGRLDVLAARTIDAALRKGRRHHNDKKEPELTLAPVELVLRNSTASVK